MPSDADSFALPTASDWLDWKHPLEYGTPGTIDHMLRCPTCEEWSPCTVRKMSDRLAVAEAVLEAARTMLDHHDALVSVPSGEPLNCTEATTLRDAIAAHDSGMV